LIDALGKTLPGFINLPAAGTACLPLLPGRQAGGRWKVPASFGLAHCSNIWNVFIIFKQGLVQRNLILLSIRRKNLGNFSIPILNSLPAGFGNTGTYLKTRQVGTQLFPPSRVQGKAAEKTKAFITKQPWLSAVKKATPGNFPGAAGRTGNIWRRPPGGIENLTIGAGGQSHASRRFPKLTSGHNNFKRGFCI
ncbi:MAG: hypothetical protein J5I94_19885, partial [Phaeodactylibacter sp.]|nr:hypothetical protein [Phaeodactylibacter sp.]